MTLRDELLLARSEITKMFHVQGFSRTPMDYARMWLDEHLGQFNERDCVMFKIDLERTLTRIAEEVMNEIK